MNVTLLGTLALATLATAHPHGAAHRARPHEPPAWLALAPGRQAYLKEDGMGSDGTTVCATPQAYFTFEDGGSTRRCRILTHGTLVRVVRVAGSNDRDGTITPLVEIGTEFGTLGITDASFLRPLVPAGTILVVRRFGDYPGQMWPNSWASKDITYGGYGQDESRMGTTPVWIPLADGTRVQVLRQIPYERGADLKIVVLSGPKRGATGWSYDLFVPDTNLLNDQFVFDVKAAT